MGSLKPRPGERKITVSLYLTPELVKALDELRGPLPRSLFAEFLLWHGLKVLRHHIGKVLASKKSLSELVLRSKKKPRFNTG